MPICVDVPPQEVSCSCHVCTPPSMGKLPRAAELPDGDPDFWNVAVSPSEEISVQGLQWAVSQTHAGYEANGAEAGQGKIKKGASTAQTGALVEVSMKSCERVHDIYMAGESTSPGP